MAMLSTLSKDEMTQMVVSRDSGPGMRASRHDLCTTLSSPCLPKHPATLFLYPLVHLFLHAFICHIRMSSGMAQNTGTKPLTRRGAFPHRMLPIAEELCHPK